MEYGADIPVATLTTLLAFANYGSLFRSLAAHIMNPVGSGGAVTLFGDVSHGGTLPNTARREQAVADEGGEATVIIDTPNPFTYVRYQAQASIGTVQTKFALLGLRR